MAQNTRHPYDRTQPSTFSTILSSVDIKFRSLDACKKLQFYISRGLSVIKDKVLAGSWFTPGVTFPQLNSYYNNKTKGKVDQGESSTYSSDSDEEGSGTEERGWISTYRSKGSRLRRILADWALRTLEEERVTQQTYYWQQQQNLKGYNIRMTRTFLNPQNVTRVALTSRIILLVLQIIVTNLYGFAKHENDGFKFTPEDGYGTKIDEMVNAMIGGFANWDGQYFLHIAVHGYTHESALAFFPLFPMILYTISKALYFFLGFVMSLSSIVLLVGWIFNTVCFMKTANVLYKITQHLNNELTPVTVLLFCFNPASVFFSSLYTESLFAFLSAKVILALCERKIVDAMAYASLSSICRSNGLLNFGFIVFFLMDDSFKTTRGNIYVTVVDVVRQCSIILIFLIPFFQFQFFAIWKFCNEKAYTKGNYKVPPPYCNLEILPYSYVQKKYWNVGFMKYFEVKQIPNFVLALPVLYLLVRQCWKRLAPLLAQSLALRTPRGIFTMYVAFHGIFLASFCFLNVHVQVSTRLILASFPYFYIYLAESCRDETALYRSKLIEWPIQSTFINCWCLTYFILGGILFPLGYPWT